MTKTILLVSALMISGLSYAGDGDDEKANGHKASNWWIGKSIVPEMSFYKSAGNVLNSDFGIDCGFRVEYNFNKYIALVSGFNFARKSFNTGLVIPKVIAVNGEEINNVQQIKNKVSMVEVPLGLRLRSDCGTKTCDRTGWTFTPIKYIGINAITAYSSSQTYAYNQDTETFIVQEKGITNFTIIPEIGLGVEIGLRERIKFILMPKFGYDIFNIAFANSSILPANNKLGVETYINFNF